MVNNVFNCDGVLVGLSYYRGTEDGTAYMGIWRQTTEEEFVLQHRISLPPAPIGIHQINLNENVVVKKGDFIGVHYSKKIPTSIIVSAESTDINVSPNALYHTYSVALFEEDIQLDMPITINKLQGGMIRKTVAIQAVMQSSDVTPTGKLPTFNQHYNQ